MCFEFVVGFLRVLRFFLSRQKPTFANSNSISTGIRGATGLSVEKLFSVTLVKQSRFMHSYDCDSEKLCLRKICTCSTQKPNSVINT